MASGATDAEATFSINLDSNIADVAPNAAAELEQLRKSIAQSTDSIRQASAANRALRGSSDEVKSARSQLKALIDSERDAVSAANIALLKQGVTYEKLAVGARKLANEEKSLQDKLKAKGLDEAKKQSEAMGKAIRVAGGPVEELSSRFETLKGILGTGAGAIAGVTLVAAGAVAAIYALASAAASLAVSFTKFVVLGADAARSMNILRLATTKTESNARNLGTQVDALSSKLSTPKEELNKLAASLGRTRLSGQAIVDTFNVVGRASDAMGDDVGSTLKDIITRGQQFNRFQLNPLELQGKGLGFDDVAGELAKNLKVGIGDARAALFEGRVSIDQGAKALRQAVEKNFEKINDAKLLAIDVQVQKFHEDLQGLTSGVNLEPLLRGFAELRGLFSQSTVMGATLKAAITTIGNALGPAFQSALPTLKQFFKGAVIGALDVGIAFLKLGKTTSKFFGEDFKQIDVVKAAEIPFKILAGAVDLLRVSMIAANLALRPLAQGLGLIFKANAAEIGGITKVLTNVAEMKGLGGDAAAGLAEGIRGGKADVGAASRELADQVKTDFADKLQIHSPSRVFVGYGEDTGEGFEQGVRSRADSAADATESLGAAPRSSSSSGSSPSSGSGGGAPSVTIRIEAGAIVLQIQGGGNGKEMTKELESSSFLANLTKALGDFAKGAAIPTQAVATP